MGSRPICACTWRRRSVIIFCADLESSCVRLKEVRPCTIVAPRTARTIGVNSCTCLCSTTLSTKYFMEPGSTKPETRLTAISTRPSANSPRLGFISAQTSGRFFHAFLRFPLLAGDGDVIAVAMILGEVYSPGSDAGDVFTTILRKNRGRSGYLQSPAVPARGTLALADRSRFKTLEMNSLTVIPRWPQSLRFKLV